jgi:hypothetical protein
VRSACWPATGSRVRTHTCLSGSSSPLHSATPPQLSAHGPAAVNTRVQWCALSVGPVSCLNVLPNNTTCVSCTAAGGQRRQRSRAGAVGGLGELAHPPPGAKPGGPRARAVRRQGGRAGSGSRSGDEGALRGLCARAMRRDGTRGWAPGWGLKAACGARWQGSQRHAGCGVARAWLRAKSGRAGTRHQEVARHRSRFRRPYPKGQRPPPPPSRPPSPSPGPSCRRVSEAGEPDAASAPIKAEVKTEVKTEVKEEVKEEGQEAQKAGLVKPEVKQELDAPQGGEPGKPGKAAGAETRPRVYFYIGTCIVFLHWYVYCTSTSVRVLYFSIGTCADGVGGGLGGVACWTWGLAAFPGNAWMQGPAADKLVLTWPAASLLAGVDKRAAAATQVRQTAVLGCMHGTPPRTRPGPAGRARNPSRPHRDIAHGT